MAAPPIFEIVGQNSWRPINNSGIEFDTTKLDSIPGSLAECDGYREHLSEEEGWVVERTYLCKWSDVPACLQWLRGYSRPTPGGISRITPAQDPYRPWLYCQRAELVEPIGVPLQDPGLTFSVTPAVNAPEQLAVSQVLEGSIALSGEINTAAQEEDKPPIAPVAEAAPIEKVATKYIPGTVWAEKQYHGAVSSTSPGNDAFSDGMARLKAVFRGVPYVVRNDARQAIVSLDELEGELGRYVERVPKYAIQGIPLATVAKQGQLAFVGQNDDKGNPLPIPEAGILLMPTATWHYTWYDVPFYPSAAIDAVVGRVNKAPFDGLVGFPLFASWQLLCQAPEIKTKRNASGQISFDITWIFDYRPQGWNYFPTKNADFKLATFGGQKPKADGSNLVFKPADFSLLFAAGAAVPLA